MASSISDDYNPGARNNHFMRQDDEKGAHSAMEIQDGRSNANFGRHWVFLRDKNGEPAITIGPQWYLSIVTIGMIVTFGLLLTGYLDSTKFVQVGIFSKLLAASVLVAYLITALKNEGILTAQNAPLNLTEDQQGNFCDICKLNRDRYTVHCGDCQVCIKGHDHHCIWSSKCIGSGNVRYFYTFLFLIVVFFAYTMVTTIYYA